MQPYNSNPFYQLPQQQQPQPQPPRFVYYPTANVPTAAAPAPIQAAYHPNLAVTVPLQQPAQPQPSSSSQEQQPTQPQQQQQLFDYEMLPNSRQLEAEEDESEKEDATKRLVKPVQDTLQQPQPAMHVAAPTLQVQPQQSFMYPPTQYMMAQQPQPAMPVQQQQPQAQQQPQPAHQAFAQQVPTANMQQQQMHNPHCHHCHCRRIRRMHLHKGLHFKILIVVQLCIAVIFTCLSLHLIPLLFDALFVFGLIMAIIQNVPGLIVFSVGNIFAVIASTWALLMATIVTLHGHSRADILIVDVLLSLVALVQWGSFISGIHYTVRIAKKRHANANAFPGQFQPQQFQPQQPQPQQLQPQHVMMTSAPTNAPGFQFLPVQQAQQAV